MLCDKKVRDKPFEVDPVKSPLAITGQAPLELTATYFQRDRQGLKPILPFIFLFPHLIPLSFISSSLHFQILKNLETTETKITVIIE